MDGRELFGRYTVATRLQCVAVRCSVLQCVAVCCNVLQCVAIVVIVMDGRELF